jgi:predicted nucleic-acid-binding protein
MIALDTNLLARLLLKDDAAQHARVKALLATDQVFTAPVTVFLELVWVLEANDCPPANVSRGLELLLGLPNFKSGQADALHQALQAYARGMDFADALHLALSQGEDAVMTSDKAFARQATRLALAPPVRTA